jgi:putative serine protease PepD
MAPPPPAGPPFSGGATPGWAAPALPAGWGAPPPSAWPPPAEATGGQTRRPLLIVGAAMLAIGLAVGAAVTAGFARDSGAQTAKILVNDQPSTASSSGNGGDAVRVAQDLGPAVGTIIAKQSSSQTGSAALGSGVVIGRDGSNSYLITNNHVVEGARELDLVMPGGKNLKATVVGTDSFDDLAVISVPDTSLKQAVFGKSSDLKVGQQVVAIGSPLGNDGSVTVGVVSALHRTISAGSGTASSSETLQDVLQTDASINPGNSGGPLSDMQGRVIGINVAVAGNTSRIGFSIPSDVAQNVAQALIARQPVKHPFLGISYLTAIDATESGQPFTGPGVLVTKVVDGTPAAQAGFHTGDVLVAVNGVDIDNGQTLGGLIQQYHVGDAVTFAVRRGSDTLSLKATLSERPKGQ